MDAASEHAFDLECETVLQGGRRHVAVDLAGLSYISSAGVGALLRLAGLFRDRNGEVVLCGAKGVVKSVLEITRVSSLFRMCDSVEAAATEMGPAADTVQPCR